MVVQDINVSIEKKEINVGIEKKEINVTMQNGSNTDKRYKGMFDDLTALQTAYPTATNGRFATVKDEESIYTWIDSAWVITGSRLSVYLEINSNIVLGTGDTTIGINANTGPINISLPPSVGTNVKYVFKYLNTNNAISIIPDGSDTIEKFFPNQGYSFTVQSNGNGSRKVVSSFVKTEYALRFDGVNDFVNNNVSTPFQERDKNQPFTFFASLNSDEGPGTTKGIFSTRPTGFNVGLIVWRSSGRLALSMGGTGANMFIYCAGGMPVGKQILQISYDGSGTTAGVKMYYNGILQSTLIGGAIVSGTMINGQNSLFIGKDFGSASLGYLDGVLRNLSFVDYVKTGAEILSDSVNGDQSIGSGQYLFASDFNNNSGLSFVSSDGNNINLDINGQVSGDWVQR